MSGPVIWIPFHESSGQANDLSGNDNHGTVNGATQGVAGKGGLTAYSFDGTDDYVDTGTWPFFGSSWNKSTISCWVKTTMTTRGHVFWSNTNAGMNIGLWLNYDYTGFNGEREGYIAIANKDGSGNRLYGGTENNVGINNGEWHHIVAVMDHPANEYRIWVDGDEKLVGYNNLESPDFTGDSLTNFVPIGAGNEKGTIIEYVDGVISDFRVYDRHLSPLEIQTLYEQGALNEPPQGTSRYTFDSDDATDSWGTNDGTVNGATFVDGLHGRAISLDGTDDNVTISGGLINQSPNAFGFGGWVKFDETGTQRCIWAEEFDTVNNDYILFRRTSGDQIRVFSVVDQAQSGSITAGSITTDVWYHLFLVVRPDGERLLYIDGELAGSNNGSAFNVDTPSDLWLGQNRVNGNHLPGDLDDFRFYPYPLGPQEVSAIYHGWSDVARPPTDGVSYYPLDGDADDAWGTNDGTVNGATQTRGVRGGAYDLDGTDDWIELPDNTITTSTWSVSFWINIDNHDSSDNSTHYVDMRSDRNFVIGDDTEDGTMDIYDGSAWNNTGISIPTGAYVHIAVTYDGTTASSYKNGALSNTFTETINNNTEATSALGARYDGAFYNMDGTIDDVRIYDRALSAYEVAELYQYGTMGRNMHHYTVSR